MPQAFLFDVIYEAYQQVRILVSENGCVGVLKNTPVLGDLLEDTTYNWTQVKIGNSEVERIHS